MSDSGSGSGLVALSEEFEQSIAAIDDVLGVASLAKVADLAPMRRAMVVAKAMQTLRRALGSDNIMAAVMSLQGMPLGFRTDKSYPPGVVRDCLIASAMMGLYPVGNEFNIIGGQPYVTQAGFARLVKEWPGVEDLEITPGLPSWGDDGAVIEMSASLKYHGEPREFVRVFAVRVNKGQGADAVIGKAKRKLLASIYETLTGASIPEGDATDVDTAPRRVENTAGHRAPGVEPDRSASGLARTAALVDKVRSGRKAAGGGVDPAGEGDGGTEGTDGAAPGGTEAPAQPAEPEPAGVPAGSGDGEPLITAADIPF